MIKDSYNKRKTVFSLEVFPPKTEHDFSFIFESLDELKKLNPDFISITYGAGGSTSKRTMELASYIQNECHIEALAHLTCVALDEELLNTFLKELEENQIHNILALRGDRPKDMSDNAFDNRSYKYASDLISIIKNTPNTCIGSACYPETHPESANWQEDLYHLKTKVDAGANFLITQLFFDNSKFYQFHENAVNYGITVPISAGIMPITSARQIKTIVELSGASIPKALSNIFVKYQDNPMDFKKAGLEYAINQIKELMTYGVSGIHLYTLNKADISKEIFENISI